MQQLVWSQELIEYSVSGARDARVNIAFIGDGYTAQERGKFVNDVGTFFEEMIRFEPMSHYRNYFNVYGMYTPSNQSGLGGYYGSFQWPGVERLISIDNGYYGPVDGLSRANQHLQEFIPEYDIAVVIVNANIYGGAGGEISVATSMSPEIVAHEVGHSWVHLADEYDYYTEGQIPIEAINVTAETNRALVKWNYWVEESTPIPTPETPEYGNVMGLFEGAAYRDVGWYRPKNNCQMRSNGIPLCAVCAEAYILQLHSLVSPIDSSVTPVGVPVAMTTDEYTDISVILKHKVLGDPLLIQWYQDGVLIPDAAIENLKIALPVGSYTVSVVVADTTSFVRHDVNNLLSDRLEWAVEVTEGTGAISSSSDVLMSSSIESSESESVESSMAVSSSSQEYEKVNLLSREQIVSISASSAHPDEGIEKAFDGDLETVWFTQYGKDEDVFPHEVIVGFDSVYSLTSMTYTPVSEVISTFGLISEYRIEVSIDSTNWHIISDGTFQASYSRQEIQFAEPADAQFVKVIALSEANGYTWASAAEFSFSYDSVVLGESSAMQLSSDFSIGSSFDEDSSSDQFVSSNEVTPLFEVVSGEVSLDYSRSHVTVSLNKMRDNASIMMYSVHGKLLHKASPKNNGETVLDVSQLNQGAYLIIVLNGGITQSFMVMHNSQK